VGSEKKNGKNLSSSSEITGKGGGDTNNPQGRKTGKKYRHIGYRIVVGKGGGGGARSTPL